MKRLQLLCALALVVLVLSGCAEMNRPSAPAAPPSAAPVLDRILASGELRVGMSGDMPPLNMVSKENKLIGMDADIARLTADAMGVKLNLQKMQFSQLLSALEAGKIDMIISNMTMTPDRNLKVVFVGPYLVSGKGLLTKDGLLTNARSMKDINSPKFTFAVLKGSTSEAVAKVGAPQARLVTVGNENEGVQMVIDGRADAMLSDISICAVAAYRNPNAGLVAVTAPITYEPIGIAIPKGDPQLTNWLQNFVNGLEKGGYMKELGEKWLGKPTWIDQVQF